MSVTVHAPQFVWARAHRAALVIVLLALALAATSALLIAQLVTGSQAPAAPVSDSHVPTFVQVPAGDHNPCPQMSRSGPTPC